MRPRNKIPTTWSTNLAYAIGLIATDGCLYKDGRHMAFISKDLSLIKTFKECLGLENTISKKKSGYVPENYAYWIQFGDVIFYKFLLSIGLTPAKSKTLAELKIPDKYFFDFLRGSFDGDGTFYSYWDKRWASSFLYYLVFISASIEHLTWIRKKLKQLIKVQGHMNLSTQNKACQLKYAKTEAKIILRHLYYSPTIPRLERKYKKIYNAVALDER